VQRTQLRRADDQAAYDRRQAAETRRQTEARRETVADRIRSGRPMPDTPAPPAATVAAQVALDDITPDRGIPRVTSSAVTCRACRSTLTFGIGGWGTSSPCRGRDDGRHQPEHPPPPHDPGDDVLPRTEPQPRVPGPVFTATSPEPQTVSTAGWRMELCTFCQHVRPGHSPGCALAPRPKEPTPMQPPTEHETGMDIATRLGQTYGEAKALRAQLLARRVDIGEHATAVAVQVIDRVLAVLDGRPLPADLDLAAPPAA
jgi:hypothetical protein